MNKYNGINGYATYNDIFKQIETNIYHVQTKKHVPSGIPSRPLKKESIMPPNKKISIHTPSRHNSKSPVQKKNIKPSYIRQVSNQKVKKAPYITLTHKKQHSTIDIVKRTPTLSPSRPRTPDIGRKTQKFTPVNRTPDRTERRMNITTTNKSPLRTRNGSCVTNANVINRAHTSHNNANNTHRVSSARKSNINTNMDKNIYKTNYNYGKTSRGNKVNYMTTTNLHTNTNNNTNAYKNKNIKNIKVKEEEIFQSFGKGINNIKKPTPTQYQVPKQKTQYTYNTKTVNNNTKKQIQSKPQTKPSNSIYTNAYNNIYNYNNDSTITSSNNNNYELPEENKIDFNEMDQFSPPFLGQQLDLNYKEQRQNNMSNYTNIEMMKHNTLNAVPMKSSTNREIIDEFLSKMENKKYSTIEYKNYPFANYNNNHKYK